MEEVEDSVVVELVVLGDFPFESGRWGGLMGLPDAAMTRTS